MEQSKAEDDAQYEYLEEAVQLSAAVADNNGKLPPPPPLPWWAPMRAPGEAPGYVPPPSWYNPEETRAFCEATGWGNEVCHVWPPAPPPQPEQPRRRTPPPQRRRRRTPPPAQEQATWPEGVPWVPPLFVDLTKDGSDHSDVDNDAWDFDGDY